MSELWIKLVADFHRKFNQPIRTTPGLPSKDVEIFRQTLLRSEYRELNDAIARNDLEGIYDGILDMNYVLVGTGHVYGLPLNQGFIAVHNANMRKEPAVGQDSTCTKPIKPPGWQPPNLRAIMIANGWR